jgi:hypothetical protein
LYKNAISIYRKNVIWVAGGGDSKAVVGRLEKPKEDMHIVPKGVFSKDKLRFRSVGWTNAPVLVFPLSEASEMEFVNVPILCNLPLLLFSG